jgi:hypothetical protein
MPGQWRRARLGDDWIAVERRLQQGFMALLKAAVAAGVSFPETVAAFSPGGPTQEKAIYFSPAWPEMLEVLATGLRAQPCDRPRPEGLACLFHYGADPWLTCFGEGPVHLDPPGATA